MTTVLLPSREAVCHVIAIVSESLMSFLEREKIHDGICPLNCKYNNPPYQYDIIALLSFAIARQLFAKDDSGSSVCSGSAHTMNFTVLIPEGILSRLTHKVLTCELFDAHFVS